MPWADVRRGLNNRAHRLGMPLVDAMIAQRLATSLIHQMATLLVSQSHLTATSVLWISISGYETTAIPKSGSKCSQMAKAAGS